VQVQDLAGCMQQQYIPRYRSDHIVLQPHLGSPQNAPCRKPGASAARTRRPSALPQSYRHRHTAACTTCQHHVRSRLQFKLCESCELHCILVSCCACCSALVQLALVRLDCTYRRVLCGAYAFDLLQSFPQRPGLQWQKPPLHTPLFWH
jgi:hypothetical protein